MTYQISFSGGMGSAVSALVALENDLDFNLIFADTLIEDEDLYRFNDDVARACGKEIIHLTDGRTPWDVYAEKRWIGNTRTAHCSTELKSKPVRAWLGEHAAPSDPLVLGMDMSELDRIERAQKHWAPRPVVSLLNRYQIWRPQYDEILARYGIRKPRLYSQGYEHNNCGGFCCKAGLVQFERLYRTNPKRFAFHEAEMDRVLAEIGPTARPFLRQVQSGVTYYLTLREFREQLQDGTMELPMFSEAGCGCFTDEEAA
ncbi:phosphoadenosine phosphosulfate reductase domain-containing protein [Halomonas sp. IOP_31]|uniref:phosphoadenosine phosphosulfate reductase domain-containing protein n=1 Tax=Halomonas sp. IOP_31 TaxID=2876584 RepID=UPI001E56C64C|nr:phosphoadenosine phosphosulfate reductase family protein [Halomonas sp. IOP_31]MCD6006880.1 phosphoadenosine phosphosulfate reductase family protein [Halomonas sp. IOP_31]